MKISTRFAALILTIGLIASACGQNTESELTTFLNEIEASLEDTEHNSDSDDTTAAEAAEALEETLGRSFAEDILLPDMTPDEMIALLNTMAGPTDDLTSEIRRIDPEFPNVTTLPDTELIGFSTLIAHVLPPIGLEDRPEEERWDHGTRFEISTSLTPEAAVRAYQDEFAALHPNEVIETRVGTGVYGETHTVDFGFTGSFIRAHEVDGTTVLTALFARDASQQAIDFHSDIKQHALAPDQFSNVTFGVFNNQPPRIDFVSDFRLVEADFDPNQVINELATAAGFTFVSEDILGDQQYTSDDLVATIQVSPSHNTREDGPGRFILTNTYQLTTE